MSVQDQEVGSPPNAVPSEQTAHYTETDFGGVSEGDEGKDIEEIMEDDPAPQGTMNLSVDCLLPTSDSVGQFDEKTF